MHKRSFLRSIDAVFRFPPSLSRRDTLCKVFVCVCVCVVGGGRRDGLLSAESFSQSAAGNGA